ncbi:outer membrane beta-barrel protein [Steroidobacter agaridevorans]|uniref:outer membrane beta-barrel protein n=1 Tax=Steroidobacter agaridevorans TaxID=2695856 RepID=UPI00132215B0|nr:outer membrane beta-barrel protein [Steroidobacter agaridevorans]GFE90274.1 hypothetical protein GCM10011488_52280 [Steroidobacter agaridevorans]
MSGVPALRMLLRTLLIPLGCLVAATASADDATSPWSFGTQLGWAQGKGDSAQLSSELSTFSLDTSATFGEKSRIGWRVFTGYRFTDYLAVHLGYTDLGKVESRLAEAIRDSFQIPESGSQQTIRGVDIGMQLKVPLGERFAMELRGGKYYWQSHTQTTSAWGEDSRSSRRDSDVFFGAGMELALFEEFSATLGWTRYAVGGEPVHLWTIGTLYRFSVY